MPKGKPISGVELFEQLLENPKSMFDLLWETEVAKTPLNTPEMRAGLKIRLLELAAIVRHPVVRAEYRKMFLERFEATYGSYRRVAAKPTANVVDMRAFAARRKLTGDNIDLLTRLSHVEDDLVEATRLLGENFTDAGFRYQQDLLRMKADIQLLIVGEAN